MEGSKSLKIRLSGHCIICLRRVSTRQKDDDYIGVPEVAPDSAVSTPGFLTTFNQVWAILRDKLKESNHTVNDTNSFPEETAISLENVLENGNGDNASFSRAPTFCQLCCDKVLAVNNLMKAVRQQVREIRIILEEGRRTVHGRLGDLEKTLRENGLEEEEVKATLQFVGIFDNSCSRNDFQRKCDYEHVILVAADMMDCNEENSLSADTQVGSDHDNDKKVDGDSDNDNDEDPDYVKEELDESDSDYDYVNESEEEMEVDYEDKNDPNYQVGNDPLALVPNRSTKDRPTTRKGKSNQLNSGEQKEENLVGDKFPCSSESSKNARTRMRKNKDTLTDSKTPVSTNSSKDKRNVDTTEYPFPCSCGKAFGNLRNRERHMKNNTKIHPEYKVYKVDGKRQACHFCGKWIRYVEILEHLTDHLNGQKELVMKCPNEKCRYMGVSPKEMKLHMFSARRNKDKECLKIWKEKVGPVCEICGFKGANMLKIWNHVRDKHENGTEKKWKCPISGCGKMFFIKQSVQYHMHEHQYRKVTRQNCDKCEENLKIEEMGEHLKDKHGVEEVIGCKQCPLKFSGREELVEHLYEHRIVGIRCDICGEDKFPRYTDFRLHYFMVHKLCPQKYKCGEEGCERWFWREETKENHELRMHRESNVASRYRESLVGERGKGVKRFGCDVCDEKFVKEDNLTSHKIKVHGAEPFKCDICEKTFHVKHFFNKHKKEHAGIVFEEWKCGKEGCGRTFKKKSNWINHEKFGHGSERPHICEICGKGYSNSTSLKNHQDTVHLKLKRYVCEECGERFGSSSVLRKHKLIHTEERPFGCEICGQRFRHKGVLTTHLKGHEEKGPDFKPNGPMKKIRKRKQINLV